MIEATVGARRTSGRGSPRGNIRTTGKDGVDPLTTTPGGLSTTTEVSPEQLGRKAHIPALKESPMGEYPTLGAFVGSLAEYHIAFHIDHMKEVLRLYISNAPTPGRDGYRRRRPVVPAPSAPCDGSGQLG
jgi:hypothetical protein